MGALMAEDDIYIGPLFDLFNLRFGPEQRDHEHTAGGVSEINSPARIETSSFCFFAFLECFDSLSFAILVARLEDDLGIDPFTVSQDATFPLTIGDFIRAYENSPA